MLGAVEWVREQRVWYWGDIDEYGFQILHMLRSMLPGVRSLLMDATTYRDHQHLAAVGSRNRVDRLDALTPGEAELYRELRSNPSRNRLEQERIPQAYAEAVLKATIV